MRKYLLKPNHYILMRALALDVVQGGLISNEVKLEGLENIVSLKEAPFDEPLFIPSDRVASLKPVTSALTIDSFLLGSILVKLSKELSGMIIGNEGDSEGLVFGDVVYGVNESLTKMNLHTSIGQVYRIESYSETFEVLPLKELVYNGEKLFEDITLEPVVETLKTLELKKSVLISNIKEG